MDTAGQLFKILMFQLPVLTTLAPKKILIMPEGHIIAVPCPLKMSPKKNFSRKGDKGTREKPHYSCPFVPKIVENFENIFFRMKKFGF